MRVLVATSDIDGKALVSGVQSEMPETKFILITDRSQLLESLDSDVFEALVVEDGAYFDSAVQRGIIESETPCIVLCRSGSESRLNGIDDFIVVGGDTQRERSELRLRIELADRRRGTQDRERQRHEIASRALREIVYRLDQNGHFTYLNESISQLGYEESDLLGKHFSTLLENESVQQVSRDSVLPPLAGTVTNGNTPGLFDERRRGARSTRELAVLMRSGNRTTAEPVLGYVTASGDVVTHSDGTSQVVGTIGVIREATRESHSIDLLRKLYTVADSSQFGILVTDASLRVQYANPAFYRTSQLNPEQVLGTSVSEIPNEGFDEGLMSELLHGCSAEVVIERDFRTQYADGSEHEMLMVGRPVYDATHKCAGVVVVIQPASVRDELDVPALAEQLVERAVGAFRRESQSGREIQIQIADASLVFANQVTGLVLSVIRELLILASLVSDTGPIQLGVGERKDGYMVAIFAQRRGLASETKSDSAAVQGAVARTDAVRARVTNSGGDWKVNRDEKSVEYIVSIPHPKSEAAHSVTAQESDPEFNLDDFARSYTDSPEVLHEIFNLYVEEAPERIKAVEAGLSSGDFDAVAKAAHSLANTSGTLQSTVTAEAARELESAARMKDEQQSEIAAKRLIALVRNILGRVEEYIADE